MAGIQEYLDLIKNAVYGRDVRQAIHDGIHQCYEDGKAGAVDLIAREEIAELIAPSGEAPNPAEVTDARIGADGVTYTNLGTANRTQFTNLKLYNVDTDGMGQVTEENTTFFTPSKNLLNYKTVLKDTRLSSNGGIQTAANYGTSNWIDVHNIDSVNFYRFVNNVLTTLSVEYVLYDSYRNAIGNRSVASGGTSIDTSNAYFIRLDFTYSNANQFMLVESSYTPTRLIPFGSTFNYEHKTIYVGAGKEFTKIKEGFEALDNGDTLIVEAGEYDLIEEFGTEFFNNFSSNSQRGLLIKSGCKYVFSPNAIIKCNYSGDNTLVKTLFSPINALYSNAGDFEIIGAHIEASNVRYVIHDDQSGVTNLSHHVYKDCEFILDNSENADWKSATCIGGGLSRNEIIDISNCYLKGVVHPNYASIPLAMSWHNNGADDSKSRITISENYCEGGTIGILYHGITTKETCCQVVGNSLPSEIVYRADTSEDLEENMKLQAWNNLVRS